MTCQGKRCVYGRVLEQSQSSEVEVEVEVGQSIDIIFSGASRMERSLLHDTTLDKCLTMIGDFFKQERQLLASLFPRSPTRRVWLVYCSANAQRRLSQSRELSTASIHNQGGE